jgi:hypothetical protein
MFSRNGYGSLHPYFSLGKLSSATLNTFSLIGFPALVLTGSTSADLSTASLGSHEGQSCHLVKQRTRVKSRLNTAEVADSG